MKNKHLEIFKPFVIAFATILSCNQTNHIASGTEKLTNDTTALTISYAEENANADSLKISDLNIFTITTFGDDNNNTKNISAFVSLSDIYHDSLAVPPRYIANQKNISFKELKYFELDAEYRRKLLKGTKIKETDTLFMYDYGLNELEKFEVKKLKAVANLTPYNSEGEQIYEGDYMLGFQIERDMMKKSATQYYNNVLVYIGNKNPFVQQKLQLPKWEEIKEKDFPKPFSNKEFNDERYKVGNHYQFKSDTITYYVRDILIDMQITRRHFIAVGKNRKNIIAERMFSESEGSSLAPLNFTSKDNFENQWTGYLFKGKPPVIFGFEYHSFGCPSITLLDKAYADIPINCDNRH